MANGLEAGTSSASVWWICPRMAAPPPERSTESRRRWRTLADSSPTTNCSLVPPISMPRRFMISEATMKKAECRKGWIALEPVLLGSPGRAFCRGDAGRSRLEHTHAIGPERRVGDDVGHGRDGIG